MRQVTPVQWIRRPRGSARAVPALAAAILAATALLAPSAAAQDDADCLACHSDPDLTADRGGREVSAFVDEAAFVASVHGIFGCVDCHQDVAGAELPHEDDLAPVDCAGCHDQPAEEVRSSVHGRSARRGGPPAAGCADCHGSHAIQPPDGPLVGCAKCHGKVVREQTASLHGRAAARGDPLAPTCIVCHGSHAMRSHFDPAAPTAVMNVPLLCGRCHKEGTEVSLFRDIPQERILEHYADSIHGEGLFQKGLTVTAVCTSCHTSHNILPHTDPASSIAHANVVATCLQCHAQIEQVHRKAIEGRLWEEEPHKIPVCVDCHEPHKIRRVFYTAGMANADCQRCHAKPELATTRDGATVSLYVEPLTYAAGGHANTSCAQCHTEVSPSKERSCETIRSPVDCSICHPVQVEQYQGSIHGTLAAQGDGDAPVCLDCHDRHATQNKTSPASPTFARNVPVLCARCHRVGERAAVRIKIGVPDIVGSYIDSIHGKGLLKSGLLVTATCVNCHSSHGELPPSDPRSTVNPANIADTCGTCHHGIEETFTTSIHFTGRADVDGGRRLPTCEDCHSSHTISRIDVPGFRTLMMEQCGYCHEAEATTFFDTFHGKVSRLGSEGAAKCYDCHGTHDILPPSDARSHLSRQNVVETCGKCHPGSHRRFAGYLTHATHHDQAKYPWLFWSFWGMTALLVGTLTFALLHTFAWLTRLWLTRGEWRAHKALAKVDDRPLYRRFNRFQRSLHIVMMLSFFTLALTGMTLKFSYAGWAEILSLLLGGFETMAVLHRLGAITLIVVFFVHLWDVWRRKRQSGRSWRQIVTGPESIIFNRSDLTEVVQSIRWFFGIGPRPRYGRYTYWEKFDYFAVFWGVIVIGSTGLVLWFPEFFTYLLPGWSVNVATIIHSDEALLAVAFIFTIHFFNTHFRPDKFPLDPVIFTGRVTVDELKYDKPREYEELVARGDLEENLVAPFPRSVERGARIFGYIALTVGLSLLGLIVYAMLFSYR